MRYIHRFIHKIADFQAKIILLLAFFIIAPLFSIISKRTSPKRIKGWSKWPYKSDSLEDLKKQY